MLSSFLKASVVAVSPYLFLIVGSFKLISKDKVKSARGILPRASVRLTY
jgi:hypothetical protein